MKKLHSFQHYFDLLYDSLLWVAKYQRFENYQGDFQSGTKKIVEPIKQIN